MTRADAESALRDWFRMGRSGHLAMASPFTDDPEGIADAAAGIFDELMVTLPYVESPTHPMAGSAFECAAALAVYIALQRAGCDIDAHRFGPILVQVIGDSDTMSAVPTFDEFQAAGAASQQTAEPNEFVFEVFAGGEDDDFRRGLNITSCAICHMCAPHDAADLVPYMCSLDDVTSDAHSQGLRRTGSIALGASHCDFRFAGRDGDPLRLSDQYPDRIRLQQAAPPR